MSWVYQQSTGKMTSPSGDIFQGYAGTGAGRNNPAMQCVKKIGPLPVGIYTIGKAYKHPSLGPCVMNLEPAPSNNMCGRSLFRIHGDNPQSDASQGCIILGPTVRKKIDGDTDKILQVIS